MDVPGTTGAQLPQRQRTRRNRWGDEHAPEGSVTAAVLKTSGLFEEGTSQAEGGGVTRGKGSDVDMVRASKMSRRGGGANQMQGRSSSSAGDGGSDGGGDGGGDSGDRGSADGVDAGGGDSLGPLYVPPHVTQPTGLGDEDDKEHVDMLSLLEGIMDPEESLPLN